jgi:hypothetical protein
VISESLDDLVILADGLENHFTKYPNAFSPFGRKASWFIYNNPHVKTKIIVSIEDKKYIYVSVNSSSVMFSEHSLTGWHPWHRNTKRYYAAWNKIHKIACTVNANSPTSLSGLFPELAQDKLEEAVWGKKNE